MRKLRLLITRIDRIGDVVLSTPIPREVKRTYPDSFIAVLVRSYTKDIYLNNPYVDEIIIYDEDGRENNFRQMLKKIRSYKFTHAFMLLPNEKLNWLLFLSGIPYRVGVGHKLYQFLTFTKYVDRRKYIPLRHEADYCMDMARKIGVKPELLDTEIFLTTEEKEKAGKFRKEILNGRRYLIGINVTSGNSAPNLTADEYKKLALKLSEDKRYKVVITDNNPPGELLELKNVAYPNINNKLRDSIINISSLDLLISSSTGPMHIAAALKVKTLSLFCPLTACSPKLWGPLGNESKIILPEENYCSTVCPGDPKLCDFSGDGGIDSDKVLSQVHTILK